MRKLFFFLFIIALFFVVIFPLKIYHYIQTQFLWNTKQLKSTFFVNLKNIHTPHTTHTYIHTHKLEKRNKIYEKFIRVFFETSFPLYFFSIISIIHKFLYQAEGKKKKKNRRREKHIRKDHTWLHWEKKNRSDRCSWLLCLSFVSIENLHHIINSFTKRIKCI